MALSPVLSAQQGLPSEALLGRILWYSVPESTRLDPKTVRDELVALGFTRKIPNTPADVDVFRRITKNAEKKKVPHTVFDPAQGKWVIVEDQFENWMVRDVSARKDTLLAKKIVCEIVDYKGHRLDYEQIIDVEFDYGTSSIKLSWINGFNSGTHPEGHALMREIRAEYEKWRGKFHNEVMRHWIRQTILGMGAVAVRPTGGIYFLEEKHATQVEALETFISEHLPVGGECHSVEIPDTVKQREMIQKAIEAETTGAVERMMAEVMDIRAAGNLTPKKFDEINKQVRALEAKMESYTKLLSRDMNAVQTRVQILAGMTAGLSNIQKKATRTRKPAEVTDGVG